MQQNNWIDIVGKFGLPSAVLIAIVIASYKTLFPFLIRHFESSQTLLKEQLDKTETARREEQKEFMAALVNRDAMAAEVGRQQALAMNTLAQEVRAIGDKIHPTRVNR